MTPIILSDFKDAQITGNGPLLATVLDPFVSLGDQNRLRSFSRFSNHDSCSADLRNQLAGFRSSGLKLQKTEIAAWVDILASYWKAVVEILAIDEQYFDCAWSKVFDAWKETANNLIRAYSTNALATWTIPCLNVVGKCLRIIAIRADSEISKQNGNSHASFKENFHDDIVGTSDNNAHLEEAARIINRMFTLCLNDR